MAEKSKSTQSQTQSDRGEKSDRGGEFVTEGKEAQEAGYWGTRDNPFPDEAFALTTGPDAPLQDAQGNPVDVDEHIQEEPPEDSQTETAPEQQETTSSQSTTRETSTTKRENK
jgi:hypothetical protein